MHKPILIFCILLAAAAILAACDSGTSTPNSNVQHLVVTSYTLGTDDLILNLRGPQNTYSQPVTYYIFGNDDLLPSGLVPLQQNRLNEQAIGPLAFGDSMLSVDLSPWAAYGYIYLRAIPVQPNGIVLLETGKQFDIATS